MRRDIVFYRSATDLLVDRQKRRLANSNGGTQESRYAFPLMFVIAIALVSPGCLGADMLLMPAGAIIHFILLNGHSRVPRRKSNVLCVYHAEN